MDAKIERKESMLKKNKYEQSASMAALEASLDWARDLEKDKSIPELASKAFQALITSPDDIPYVLAAQNILAHILDINTRLNVAYRVEENLRAYWPSRYIEGKELLTLENEFRSFIMYLRALDTVISRDRVQTTYENKVGSGSAIPIDTFLYHYYIGVVSGYHDFLRYSQALYHYSKIEHNPHINPFTLPVYVHLFKDKITVPSIISFCQSLIDAENAHRDVMQQNPAPVTVGNFPLEKRNKCFDEYISIKASEELKLLAQNNDRPSPPDLYEAKVKLLEKEVQAFKNAQDKGEEDQVLRMAELFIIHLRKDLGWSIPEEKIDPMSEEYNIPNLNSDIDRRIKAVYKSKLCPHKGDWGAVFKLWVEDGLYKATEYKPAAERINNAIGKKNVTTASAIRQSPALSIIKGEWRKEGWEDRVHNKTSGTLLLRYVAIVQVYTR